MVDFKGVKIIQNVVRFILQKVIRFGILVLTEKQTKETKWKTYMIT